LLQICITVIIFIISISIIYAEAKKLYQVVWDDSDPEVMERERRALRSAENELNIEGTIITPKNYLEKVWQAVPRCKLTK